MLLFFTFFVLAASRYSIHEQADPEGFARRHKMRHVARVAGFDIFEPLDRSLVSDSYLKSLGLRQQHKRKHYKRRVTSSDPLYPSQWHLHDNPFSVGVVEGATGEGVAVAIVDDGLQHDHPDLQGNYDASLSYDFNGHDKDPAPYTYDTHGTSCAGVCCSIENNRVCGRGIAPKASIVGLRLIAASVYDYEEALALSHESNRIRIYSSSWGPADSGMDMVGPGQVTHAALKKGYESGQSIFVWAGGNGRNAQDMSNYDGYANSPYTLAIGAVDHTGHQAWYSESGANLLAVAPSSGAGKGVTTVDLHHCTNHFGGTSSAAPLAAGLIALMLEKRPDLRTRDVQHIIAKTASKNLRGNFDWANGHCNEVGFGLLRTKELLEETARHALVPHPVKYVKSHTVSGGNTRLPARLKVDVPDTLSFIEQVLVTVQMTHGKRGQVGVKVESPAHTVSVLAQSRRDTHSGRFVWTYTTLRHWSESLKRGTHWTVDIDDLVPNDAFIGTVQSVQITWMGY